MLQADGQYVQYVALDLVDTGAALKRELEPSRLLAKDGKEVTLLFDQYEVSGLGETTYRHLAREIADYPTGTVRSDKGSVHLPTGEPPCPTVGCAPESGLLLAYYRACTARRDPPRQRGRPAGRPRYGR